LPIWGGYATDAVHWLVARDPHIASKLLMGGSAQGPIAFYANARWLPWYEAPQDYPALKTQILTQHPDFFLIEAGGGYERAANEQAVEQLRSDAQLAPHLIQVDTYPVPDGATLFLFSFRWFNG
jgi:hypothetical protein